MYIIEVTLFRDNTHNLFCNKDFKPLFIYFYMGKKYVKRNGKEYIVKTDSIFGIEYETTKEELYDKSLSSGKETRPWDGGKDEVSDKKFLDPPNVLGRGSVGGQKGKWEKKSGDTGYKFDPGESGESSGSGSSDYSSSGGGGGGSEEGGGGVGFGDLFGISLGLVFITVPIFALLNFLGVTFSGIPDDIKNFLYPSIRNVEAHAISMKDMSLNKPFPPKSISIEKIVGKYVYTYKSFSRKKERKIFKVADLNGNKILDKDEISLLEKRIKGAVMNDRPRSVDPRKVRKMVLNSYSSESSKNKKDNLKESTKSKPKKTEKISYEPFLNRHAEFSKNAPENYIPVIKIKRDGNNNLVSRDKVYLPKTKARNIKVRETEIIYPKTGNLYLIKRQRYPKFYEIVDKNNDGYIDIVEMNTSAYTELYQKIVKKHPEGDIESIVKEFLLKYSSRKTLSVQKQSSKLEELAKKSKASENKSSSQENNKQIKTYEEDSKISGKRRIRCK